MTTFVPNKFEVGDPVSYGFNGDSYPDGFVARITKKYLWTTTGRRYYKRMISDWDSSVQDHVMREAYTAVGSHGWWLCKGHIHKLNPHF